MELPGPWTPQNVVAMKRYKADSPDDVYQEKSRAPRGALLLITKTRNKQTKTAKTPQLALLVVLVNCSWPRNH